MQTFAIGDIHGCARQLQAMLTLIEQKAQNGTVVFLGDYVDRGPASKDVISRIMQGPRDGWTWIALKGNHEEMMVQSRLGREPTDRWMNNGGVTTLQSFGGVIPDGVIAWADALPTMHMDNHRVYAHAGIDQTKSLEEQTENDLLWSRFPPTTEFTDRPYHVVHGHTPVDQAFTCGNVTNVDSGCVFGGPLTCAVFDDGVPGGPSSLMTVNG